MIEVSAADPERFSALADDAEASLAQIREDMAKGWLAPENLHVAADEMGDIGRVGLLSLEDDFYLAFGWRVRPRDQHPATIYTALSEALVIGARRDGLPKIYASVIDHIALAPDQFRRSLLDSGWVVDGERLELRASPAPFEVGAQVARIDPADPGVVTVMAQAMSDSLDDYDQGQVASLGAAAAATTYRDHMVDPERPLPWLGYRESGGSLEGVAAVQHYQGGWNLGYLGVDPSSRRKGIGSALVAALLDMAHEHGVDHVSASVNVVNDRIRGTLDKLGFEVHSLRTDFRHDLG